MNFLGPNDLWYPCKAVAPWDLKVPQVRVAGGKMEQSTEALGISCAIQADFDGN